MLGKNRVKRALVMVIVLGSLALAAQGPVAAQPEAVATLTPIQGLIQVRADSAPEYEWQTVTEAVVLHEGDWVQTDHVGLAEIVFFEGNLVEVLPDSLIQIAKFALADDDSTVLTIDLSVGDLHHEIEEALDDESRYEVHTPSAVITVRGTSFFSGVTWQGATVLNHETGQLALRSVLPDGVVGAPRVISERMSLAVGPDGTLGPPAPFNPPDYPPPAPLAPITCGNAICEPGERDVCALDCRTSATCGNGICEPEAFEGPVTCRVDCVPDWEPVRPPVSGLVIDPTPTSHTMTGEACTVSTTAASSVVVYVGPGFNRGRRLYLVANVAVPVVGQLTDEAGNLWWNVNPPDYLPAESNRYWVVASAVTEAGDCARVPQVAAPPITNLPPSAPPVVTPVPPATGPSEPAEPAEPALPPFSVSFYADKYVVNPRQKECATLFWSVSGVKEVYYQGQGVTGEGSRTECPTQTTTYSLTVVLPDDSRQVYTVTIDVSVLGN